MLADARAFEAHLALLQGREGEAARWAAQADRNIRTAPMPLFYAPDFTLVEILLAQGTPASLEEAARLLARLHEVVQATHNTRFLIEALALQALLHDARREQSAALDALQQAVALAEPGGVIRVFVDLGPRMAALLHQLAAQRVGPAGFIATAPGRLPGGARPRAGSPPVEPDRAALRARAGGAGAPRPAPDQQGDRPGAEHLPHDRETPQQQHLPEARRRRSPRSRCQGRGARARVCSALSPPPDAA